MSAPLATIRCYNDLIDALRARKAELGLSDATLDQVAGLADGHTCKVLGPSRDRGIGSVVLEAYLQALAINLVMVEDSRKLAAMKPHYSARKQNMARTNHPVISRDGLRRVMQALARRSNTMRTRGERAYIAMLGGNASAAARTPEQRQAAARIAARARWARRRKVA